MERLLWRSSPRYKDLLREILTPKQRKIAAAFVQAPGDYFDADPTFKQSGWSVTDDLGGWGAGRFGRHGLLRFLNVCVIYICIFFRKN